LIEREVGVPCKGFVVEGGKLAAGRELAGEIVEGEIQRGKAPHQPNLLRDWPCQMVSGNIQIAQAREVFYALRNLTDEHVPAEVNGGE